MALISPHLWYVKEAVDAARFYCSVFPDSRIDKGRRTTEAMLGMVKLDIAALERAHAGA